MKYLTFLLVFLVIPIVLLAFYNRKQLPMRRIHRPLSTLMLLSLIALVYTTPWDNYLVYRGVWLYGSNRVIGTIGYVPIEEYLFFLLQPLFLSLLFLAFLPKTFFPPKPSLRWHSSHWKGTLIYSLLTFLGVVALKYERLLYAGLILVWAGPVLLGQWAFGAHLIRTYAPTVLKALSVGVTYLWIIDSWAIHDQIWTIAAQTSTGLKIGPLPVEEALFFFLTSLMVLQGLALLLHPQTTHDVDNTTAPHRH
ncbi:lycopene cyclase domain-containing protein [Rhodothermus bifroesti]|uniref:Lycopene cyclase domain-containing protein n=1 Tax=Rhodothermus marinus TaxID=29549 RepID=A0A7V2F5F8_RHOMR|nr:lycopene cyclase domain-containing protein [Rhodothermus bifroesti]